MLSLCSSPVFVLIFIVCLGTNFVVSAFYIFLKLFSLLFKIIWSHRELPLSSFFSFCIFSHCHHHFFSASLFFNCHFCSSAASYTLSLCHLSMEIIAGIVFIANTGGVFAVGPLKTGGKLALTGCGWQVAITSFHPALGQSAPACPALGWAFSEHRSIPMEQQRYDEGGKHGWWRPVYRMSNTANQQERGEKVLKPGCWCQGGDYSR